MKNYKFYLMILAVFMTLSFSTRAESVVDIIVNSPNHTILETALIEANLVDDLEGSGSFTVFAPTDASFNALPTGTIEALLANKKALTDVLLYHVVKGKVMSTALTDGLIVKTYNDDDKKLKITINENGVFINNAKVTVADIEAENGVVHVIDAVLLPPTMPATVVDIIVNSANHNTLEAAVVAAGLVETLQGAGPFTVFAPTDAAFAALHAGVIESLLADPTGALKDILLYHVVAGKAMSSDLSDGQMIETVLGKDVKVTINADGVFINSAKVTVADIEAENGVVHVIDAIMLPPAIPATVADIIVNSENHNTLEAAVVAAGLVPTLQGGGPFTVFAPTDAAFAALPAGTVEALLADIPALTNILTYHVVGAKAMSSDLSNGQVITTVLGKKVVVKITSEGVFINNAKVTGADLEAGNGVVHVIDAVLLPQDTPATVVDIIVNSANHNTLEAAVVAAGLVETLQGAGPFTVFAPTDAAFAALPAGTVEALLADIPALTNILTYHVVGAKAMSSDLSDGQMITTVLGKDVTVKITADGVFINNAKVTVADIVAENGVVHVIDAVLLPPTMPATVVDIIVNSANHTTLEAAVVAAGLEETLQGAGPFTVFAPTDAAFAALPNGTVESLLEDPTGALTDILLYHVVSGKAMSSDLSDGQMITTVLGKDVTVKITADGVFINNAKVTVADIVAENGVVHVIDAVLLPPTMPATVVDIIVNSANHNTLEAAVVAAGLVETLQGAGPFTVFAPTDAAFAALPAGTVEALLADIPALTNILTYHVVGAKAMSSDLSDGQMITTVLGKDVKVTINADGVFINNAKVTVADIEAENGVVHVIDAVLLPPTMPATVVDIIVNSENHTTLEAAVVAAGLVETLQGAGPFTVFAPTDAAFAALPAGTVESLLEDPTGALTDILLYHVVSGKAMSSDLSDGQMIETVLGKDVKVMINADGVFINNAKVTVADIVAENGVVHVIDAVLLPPVDKAAFPITFEAKTDAVWTVFSNGAGAADDFMIIANPDKTGNNTSDNVLKFKVNIGSDPWAGAFSDSYSPVVFNEKSHVVTMMVWKSVISPVGFKVEASTNGGPVTEMKVSNTLINQWEKITFDLSSLIGFSYNRIVIFPDFPNTRTSGTTVYIDNIEKENPLPATVVDIIVNSENHNTLEAAVVAAGLVETLQGAGPFTVFAPTDAAFAALPAGTVESLLEDPTGALTDILLYHVVAAKAMSSDLSDGQMITTVLGKDVKVTINADGVFINNAKVTVADIEAENGVVHVIDVVLIPTITSISVLQDISFEVYPNPASDYIRINSNIENSLISIRDIAGRVVTELNNVGSNDRIDISGFNSGIYLVTVKNGNSFSTKKLIVQ